MREVKRLENYVENIQYSQGAKNIISVEHRTNNNKRDFLFVNRCQCKHIPCRAHQLFSLCNSLVSQIYEKTKEHKILIIGFAETATAIANIIADELPNGVVYMQTTREQVNTDNVKFVIEFSEEHSHAPNQYLVSDKAVEELNETNFDYVLFVDDEITTGKTIMNCISKFGHYFPDKQYGVASICNWQSSDDTLKFTECGIDRFYIMCGEIIDVNRRMNLDLADYTDDCTIPPIVDSDTYTNPKQSDSVTLELKDYKDERLARYLNKETRNERNGVVNLIAKMAACKWGLAIPSHRYVIIGTEEFMSIPCYVGSTLEHMGYNVMVQATTRSPISVINGSTIITGEICNKAKIKGAYDKDRDTYLYNLKYYDGVLVITDGEPSDEFYLSILNGFGYVGVDPEDITFIRLVR